MRSIFCLSIAIPAIILTVVNAAPVGENSINLAMPEIPLDNYNDIEADMYYEERPMHMMDNVSPGPTEKAAPPLENYFVKDIQRLSYPNLVKFFTDLVKYRMMIDPQGDTNAYMNQLCTAFDKARAPGTIITDNIIYSVILAYRSFGYRLEDNPDRFSNFQRSMLDLYLPLLSPADQRDFRRIVMSLKGSY